MVIIHNFDYIILNAIQQSLRCEFLDSFTLFLSYVTTSGIIWVVAGIVMLFSRKHRASGIIMLVSLTVVFLTGDVLLKHLVNRPRPFTVNTDIALLIEPPSGSSFPSTHSAFAAASTTVLLARNKLLGFIVTVITVCIAFSRLYLYVHYPTDVLAGLMLGTICASMILVLEKQTGLERKILR